MGHYISDTIAYICTMRQFCDTADKWCLQRETEVDTMREIKDRAEKIDAKFEDVRKSKEKVKAFGQYLWSGLSSVTADSKRQELEKELGAVLKDTLEGLEKLQRFLEAVEKLAVTSLFMFTDGYQLLTGVSPADVRSIIFAARVAAPLLVHFKRDDAAFFLPNLNNVEVLAIQMEKYIHIFQQLCEWIRGRLKKTPLCTFLLCHILLIHTVRFWKEFIHLLVQFIHQCICFNIAKSHCFIHIYHLIPQLK